MKKTLLLLTVCLLSACASGLPKLDYSNSYPNVISFSKDMVGKLGAGLVNIASLANRETVGDGFNEFSTMFHPRHGGKAIDSSFAEYCSALDGKMKYFEQKSMLEGWCVDKSSNARFYYSKKPYDFNEHYGIWNYGIVVREPINTSESAIANFNLLYKSKINEIESEKVIQQREFERRTKEQEAYKLKDAKKKAVSVDWLATSEVARKKIKEGDSVYLIREIDGKLLFFRGLIIEAKKSVAHVQFDNLSPSLMWVETKELYASPIPEELICWRGENKLCLPK